jgi:hypothetical protein
MALDIPLLSLEILSQLKWLATKGWNCGGAGSIFEQPNPQPFPAVEDDVHILVAVQQKMH